MFRLSPEHEEYKVVIDLFLKTSTTKTFSHLTIDRIQSHALWEDFYMYRERMFRSFGLEGLNEKLLWHGCAGPVVLPIASQGFDWRLCGLHGTAYGRGAYFAKKSQYSQSDTYSKPDPGTGIKHIFLTRVICGRETQGSGSLQLPPLGYHSAVNNTNSPTIVVSFDLAQAYPMYHIAFRR